MKIDTKRVVILETADGGELEFAEFTAQGENTTQRLTRWMENRPKLVPLASLTCKLAADWRLKYGTNMPGAGVDERHVMRRDGVLVADKPVPTAEVSREIIRQYRMICGEPADRC